MGDERNAKDIHFVALGKFRGLTDEHGRDLAAVLIDMFEANTPSVVARIRQSTARADAPEVHRLAHSLKGSAAMLGATRIAETASAIEAAAAQGVLDGVSSRLDAVVEQLPGTVARLRAELAKPHDT